MLVAAPLGVPAGATTKVTLRGVGLEGAEVRCHHPKVRVKQLGPVAKASGPPAMGATVGEGTLDVEIIVPADVTSEAVTLALVNAAGEGPAHRLLIDDGQIADERESNDGFRDARPLALPAAVAGAIQAPLDVDVYRIDGSAGQRLTAEVQAARLGSPLDAALTLYDAAGLIVATADDAPGSRDPILTVTLPRAGPYYLAVSDANERGGASHVYRLLVRTGP